MNSIQNGNIHTILERERTPIYWIHLSALLLYVIPAVGNIGAALIAWLTTRDISATVNQQGKHALNFQLSLSLYIFSVCMIALAMVLVTLGIAIVFVPFLLFPLLGILSLFQVVTMIMAIISTNQGRTYVYPLTISFLK